MILDEVNLLASVNALAAQDEDLAAIVARFGPPPLWARPAGFPTLIHIILEQQVSLASAKAAFDRLCALVNPLTPEGFLALDDVTLKACGFSRQKSTYGRYLAQEIVEGRLDLAALENAPDEEVRARLVQLKGIGPWSADIYLLMALRRPDVWPAGDLGLAVAAKEIKQLPVRPGPDHLTALAEPWRPYRAVAARLLWHYYLSR